MCSSATVPRWTLYLWSWQLDLYWNIIILFLLRFTVRALVWLNLCRRSRCCCRPSLFGDRSTSSSANRRHLTSDSRRVRPGVADCSSALANLLIDMLKRVGLKLHPCLTPWPCGKKCVCFLQILTTQLNVYMDFILLYVFPLTHCIADPHSKSTKHEMTLPLF